MMNAREIAHVAKGKRTGNGWQIRCPAPGHSDWEPSCTVIDGLSGPVFNCFAGCDWRDIRAGAEMAGWIEPFAGQPARSRKDRFAARAAAKAALAQREAEMETDRQARIKKGCEIWDASEHRALSHKLGWLQNEFGFRLDRCASFPSNDTASRPTSSVTRSGCTPGSP